MPDSAAAPTLSATEFRRFSELLFSSTGIVLNEGKEGLIVSRLAKRLRALELPGFRAYLDLVEAKQGEGERATMIDLLTTNTTHFWREPDHFTFFEQHVVPAMLGGGLPPAVWSAGCSSGEEPYTLAMLALRGAAGRRINCRVLATDISGRILDRARRGIYETEALKGLAADLRSSGFVSSGPGESSVSPAARGLVHFAPLNLMGEWPMKGPFAAIFCRNVMIYFDRPSQERLVQRFARLLAPGGYLFIGHSESIQGMGHGLQYISPACYRRVAETAGSQK